MVMMMQMLLQMLMRMLGWMGRVLQLKGQLLVLMHLRPSASRRLHVVLLGHDRVVDLWDVHASGKEG